MSSDDKRWPAPGDRLVHKFRGGVSEVVAQVVSVNRDDGKISVKVNGQVYVSLSSAAKAVAGHSTNGWIFWGLMSRVNRPLHNNPARE